MFSSIPGSFTRKGFAARVSPRNVCGASYSAKKKVADFPDLANPAAQQVVAHPAAGRHHEPTFEDVTCEPGALGGAPLGIDPALLMRMSTFLQSPASVV